MKIEQKAEFQPITITLETEQEAEQFFQFIQHPIFPGSEGTRELQSRLRRWDGWARVWSR